MRCHITPYALKQLSLHYVWNIFDIFVVAVSIPTSTTWDLTLLQFLGNFGHYVFSRGSGAGWHLRSILDLTRTLV